MTFKSLYSDLQVQDEYISRLTTSWREILLHQDQLTATGIGPSIEVGFTGNPVDGDTITFKNDAVTEVYTFKAAAAVAFDVQIGAAFTNTRDNLLTAINTDSALYAARIPFSSSSNLIVFRTAYAGANDSDRVFASLTTPANMVYMPLDDGYYQYDVVSEAIQLIAADPVSKEFGFGRIAADFQPGETHPFLYLAAAQKYNPLTFAWDFVSSPIRTGTYTGDGTIAMTVLTGFSPKYVMVVPRQVTAGATLIFITTDVIVDDNALGMGLFMLNAGSHHRLGINQIIALPVDGFTVDDAGANEHPNSSLIDYNFIAFG